MADMSYTLIFKDGSEARQDVNYDKKSELLLGLTSGFEHNGEININGSHQRRFEDVKSIEINFHD